MDDEEVGERQLVETQQGSHRPSRFVHEGQGFGEHNFAPAEFAFTDHGFELQAPDLDIERFRERIDHQEAEVVTGMAVCQPRVAQSDDHHRKIFVDVFHVSSVFAILYFNTENRQPCGFAQKLPGQTYLIL